MVDNIPGTDPVLPTSDALPLEPAPGIGGFLASRNGRIAIIVGAVVVFLGIVGVVAMLVLGIFASSASKQAALTIVNSTAVKPASATTRTAEASSTGTKIVIPVTNADVFTARDPFVPVVQPVVEASASVDTTPSADEAGTLTLLDIITQNGVKKAMLRWENKTQPYVLGVGEQLDTTPWKVLAIGKATVTMLYGDLQVTLSIGEGVAK